MKTDALRMASALAALSALTALGNPKTYYVNNTTGDNSYDGLAAVYDGTHGPKLRIQAAIEAASAGDTVLVAPGVYGDEQESVPASKAGQTVRVYIDKAITLKSSGGREATFIVGRRGADDDGTGEGAVTGMRVAAAVATGAGDPVEIEGFTFRDCYTDTAEKVGGVIGWNGSTPVLAAGSGPWVAACTISNCTYDAYGALGRVNAAGVYLRDNSGTLVGVNAYQCNLVHCGFNGARGQVGINGSASQYAINCTFVNGSHNPCSSSCLMNFLNCTVTACNNTTVKSTSVSDCVMAGTPSSGDYSDPDNLFDQSYRYSQVAAPLFDDLRPLVATAGICGKASLCGRGDPKWLELVPEKYRYVDMEGTAFEADENGKIHVGAVQTSMTPVAGFYLANIDGAPCIRVDGMRGASEENGAYYATFTFLDSGSWPRCYELSADVPKGRQLWAFSVGGEKSGVRFPTRDGRVLYVPEKGALTSVDAYLAGMVLYVDATNGNDEYDGLSPTVDGTSGPFETIQKAVEMADTSYANIWVAPGVYKKGATEYGSGVRPFCRVAVKTSASRVRIVSTGSAEDTVIAGEPDTTSDSSLVDTLGNGPAAVRCVRFHSATVGCLQGFTITGGHTDSYKDEASLTSWRGGGAFISENRNAWLMDCIVTNNCSAGSGAAMYGGTAVRCVFADNFSTGDDTRAFYMNARLVGCVLTADEDSAGQKVFRANKDTMAIHCSSFASVPSYIFTTSDHSYLFNNVVVNNVKIGGEAAAMCASGNVMDGTVYGETELNQEGDAFVDGSAYYVDGAAGDLRISSGSSAIGAGTAWSELATGARLDPLVAWTNYYSILHHDFDGNGLCFTDGNPTAGAYQKPAKYLVLAPVNRPGDVSVSTVMTNMLDFGETITVSAADGDRKVIGLEVNGVFTDATSFTATAPDSAVPEMTTVKVLANTNWYVDAVNGSDDGTGWTEDDAFLTLSNAVSVAIPGDTVTALPGVYREGDMLQENTAIEDSSAPALKSRVIVPSGVSLVSRDGAEATVIEGGCADPDVDNGLGEGSVRCVYLQKGARLYGFTVTGGATFTTDHLGADDNNSGAGIFCAEAPRTSPETLVADCIISNNVSFAGGGGAYRGCVVLRCRFFDNGSRHEGGALANCCAYECLFDRNYGTYGVSQPYRLHGCTFGPETFGWSKTGNRCALRTDPVSAVWNVQNCLFLGGVRCPVRHAQNCIIPSDDFFYTTRESSNWIDISVAEVEVGDDYAPAFGSAAANAADTSYARDMDYDGDVYGNPRRSNGGMDVGAVETDWRPRYAAFLGSRVTVPEVSWEATATGSPGILLPDGSSLSAEWTYGVAGRGTAVLKFEVGEGAVLTVRREGKDPLTFGAGAGEYRFRDAGECESFAFSVTGGDAEILCIDREMPLSIVIR